MGYDNKQVSDLIMKKGIENTVTKTNENTEKDHTKEKVTVGGTENEKTTSKKQDTNILMLPKMTGDMSTKNDKQEAATEKTFEGECLKGIEIKTNKYDSEGYKRKE